MKKKPRPVLTALVIDPWASLSMPREEEIQMHVERFTALLNRPLTTYELMQFDDSVVRIGTQLILFDYGGMSVGNTLMEDNSRRLIRWAKDHPSALVVVVSRFTFQRGVRDELMEQGFGDPDGLALVTQPGTNIPAPLLHNVVCGDSSEPPEKVIPAWFRKALEDADQTTDARPRRGNHRSVDRRTASRRHVCRRPILRPKR